MIQIDMIQLQNTTNLIHKIWLLNTTNSIVSSLKNDLIDTIRLLNMTISIVSSLKNNPIDDTISNKY